MVLFVLVSGGLVVTREDPGRTPEDELYEASVISVTRRGTLSFDGRKTCQVDSPAAGRNVGERK